MSSAHLSLLISSVTTLRLVQPPRCRLVLFSSSELPLSPAEQRLSSISTEALVHKIKVCDPFCGIQGLMELCVFSL